MSSPQSNDAVPVTVTDTSQPQPIPRKIPVAATVDEIKQMTETHHNGNGVAATTTSTEVVIDYVLSADLKPILDPTAKIQGLVEEMESKDWITVCDSLNDARRFALFHSVLLIPVLEKVVLVLVKAMKNPRSALCKTSIMASADVFVVYGDCLLEDEFSKAFDQLLLQLLLKASQDKRFVCEEAEKSLDAMVQSFLALPLLHKLKAHARHTNPRVRAKAATSISNCVKKMKPEELNEFGPASLVRMAADLLNDRLPEAREAARGIVISLYESFISDPEIEKQESWQNFCESNLPALHAQSTLKITSPQ
ncbi:TOG array regulator of axonemal microtubules protein 1-like protein [Drosera capensis]